MESTFGAARVQMLLLCRSMISPSKDVVTVFDESMPFAKLADDGPMLEGVGGKQLELGTFRAVMMPVTLPRT